MKSSLVHCVLLGLVLAVGAASVPRSVEAVTVAAPVTGTFNSTTMHIITHTAALPTITSTTMPTPTLTTTPTTTPTPTTMPCGDTTTTPTPPTPTTTSTTTPTPTCCGTTPPPTTTHTTTTPSPSAPNPAPQTSPPADHQIMCPDGWEVFQGLCYYFENEGMTWPQAQSNCAMLESMLVSVHSVQEYAFLQQFTSNNGWADAWLGGFYLQDDWLWLDGSWFYNNSWSIESPDSSNPCLLLNSNEGWSNSPCNAGGFSSICVKNSNVPPAMVCPEGWTGFRGRCYYYNSDSLTWPEADSSCSALDASLVSVHSREEYYLLYQQTAANDFSPAWLGGFYLEDQWLWLDGSWFYQGFFYQMSPESTNPCLQTFNADGWSNYDCDSTFPSFCVKNEAL